jgi:hypothetical protein
MYRTSYRISISPRFLCPSLRVRDRISEAHDTQVKLRAKELTEQGTT